MSNSSRIPPLASPHGEDTFPAKPRPDENCARIAVHLRFVSACRYWIFEFLMPFNLWSLMVGPLVLSLLVFATEYRRFSWLALPLLFILILVGLILIAAPIALFIRLCSKRHFEVWIADTGLFKRYPNRDIFFPWDKFIWLIQGNGNLWLASFMDGCFIPREAFASPEEAHEFATIIRELKRTRGSVWRDKWNGRIFGSTPTDVEL